MEPRTPRLPVRLLVRPLRLAGRGAGPAGLRAGVRRAGAARAGRREPRGLWPGAARPCDGETGRSPAAIRRDHDAAGQKEPHRAHHAHCKKAENGGLYAGFRPAFVPCARGLHIYRRACAAGAGTRDGTAGSAAAARAGAGAHGRHGSAAARRRRPGGQFPDGVPDAELRDVPAVSGGAPGDTGGRLGAHPHQRSELRRRRHEHRDQTG